MYVVEFRNYTAFLKATIKNLPNAGRGQARRLSELLNVAPIAISKVLSGERDLTPDQAIKVANYFGFDDMTTEYFLLQVSYARAESRELKAYYMAAMDKIKRENEKIKNLVIPSEDLSSADKAEFYSNWYYSGIWLISSIEGFQTVDSISTYFGMSRTKVSTVVAFLVKVGLCVEEHGKIRMGPKAIFIQKDNPLLNNHLRHWRDRAIVKFTEPNEDEIFYSCPVSVSKADAAIFKKEFLELIKSFSRRVGPSEAQILMCFNLDWFRF